MTPMQSRAKIKDTGYWIEGYYACESNHACFQNQMKYTHFIFKDEFMDWGIGGLVRYEVIPETVGRDTGTTDKNGKKIFEGDILEDDWGKRYRVFYTTKNCSFMVECFNSDREYETGNYRVCEAWCGTIKVIGNIHDNSEFLKGGESDA